MQINTSPSQIPTQAQIQSQVQGKSEAQSLALDGVSSPEIIKAKAQEFEEIFIADSLKNAKIGMTDSSLIGDTKITDTFSSFMHKALAETIVSQGGFGLSEHIANSLLQTTTQP